MPHDLFLHSALVQSRKLWRDEPSMRSVLRFNTIDTTAALAIAFLINAAILVLAALVLCDKATVTVADGQLVTFGAERDWIHVAHLTLVELRHFTSLRRRMGR
jgi:manganese transport protein